MVNIDKIKTLASDNGIKLSFITQKLGVQHTYFADIKRHNRDIPDDRLQTIAEILNTTPEYLRDQTDEKEKAPAGDTDEELNEYLEFLRTDPNYRMMFSLMKGATKEDVEKAVKVIKSLLGED